MTAETKPQPKPKKVFVISPIGADSSPIRKHADLFLNYVVKVALPSPEYEVTRADGDDSPYAITAAMLSSILNADICVADITGRNPNVFYELALAHAMDRHVVIMDGDKESSPFDIKDMRAIKFGFMPDELEKAVTQLRAKAVAEDLNPEFKDMMNPVATTFRAWLDRQRAETSASTSDQAMVKMMERLESKVDRVVSLRAQEVPKSPTARLMLSEKDFLEQLERDVLISLVEMKKSSMSSSQQQEFDALKASHNKISDGPFNSMLMQQWLDRASAFVNSVRGGPTTELK